MRKKPMTRTRPANPRPLAANRSVAEGLAALAALDRAALVARWTAAFGCPAPRHVQAPLLRLALGHHLQLDPTEQGRAVCQAVATRLPTRPKVRALAPGTRLLREWQGATHHVTVKAKGFEYAGATYASLTAIARRITGTAWSGPLFFGLRP